LASSLGAITIKFNRFGLLWLVTIDQRKPAVRGFREKDFWPQATHPQTGNPSGHKQRMRHHKVARARSSDRQTASALMLRIRFRQIEANWSCVIQFS
jgi:hypothetical protein